MHVVLATDVLAAVGGTETYVLTVAENLVRLGHQVTVSARRLGEMGEAVRGVGADVVLEDDLPPTCDGVLVQDVGTAYALAQRWPDKPQVFVAHSAYFDAQLPPLLPVPGSVAVVMNDRLGDRIRALALDIEIVRLRQPINSLRLAPRGAPRNRPRKAVLLGSYLKDEAREALVEAWAHAKISVVQIGLLTDPVLDVAAALADADIVVGKARAILDAMACGRPAFVYDAFGADGWVTSSTYDALEADGFAGQVQPRALDAEALLSAVGDYDPDMGRVNRELILKHHQDRKHAEALVALLRRVGDIRVDGVTASAELSRLSRLRWKAEREANAMARQVDEVTRRLHDAEERLRVAQQRRRQRARAAQRAEARLIELGEEIP